MENQLADKLIRSGDLAHSHVIVGIPQLNAPLLPSESSVFRILRQFYLLFQCIKLVRKNRYKRLHFCINPSIISSVIAFLFSNAIDVSVSIVDANKGDRADFSFIEWLVWKYTLERAVRIDCLSFKIKENIVSLFDFLEEKRIFVAPCSFSFYQEFPQGHLRSYDLAFVSRLVSGKGIEMLLDCLDIFEQKNQDIRVIICGKGPLEPLIKERIKDYRHVDVEMGYCCRPIKKLVKSKIFLSLQVRNNYPSQSLLEACGAGCGIIATDVGETDRIIQHMKTGILIEKSETALFQAVNLLLSNPNLREKLGGQAREYVMKYHTLDRYLEYFSGFLGE